jgi:hypothetical protein
MQADAPRQFTKGAPAVCRSAFMFAGKSYQPGESFPYETLGLSDFDVYGQWLAMNIDIVAAPPATSASQVKAQKQRHDRR